MPILNLKITNPEAIELIRKIKTREIFIPVVTWIKKYRWFLIAFAVVIILLIALAIGKKVSEGTPIPSFIPPEIENPVPTTGTTIKSDYSGLKEEIQNINTDLPDPFIPVFDNNLNLEETIN
jgi:hypothetical protein